MEEAQPVELETTCPYCGQEVAYVPAEAAQLLTCPSCTAGFIAPALDGSVEIPREEPHADVPDDVLTAIRIRQLSAERRATYRASSYCVVAAGACLVTAVQLAWMIVQHVRQRGGWGIQCNGYVLFIALLMYGLYYFASRARQLHREASRSQLVESATVPDFSALGDGSKRAANLEEIR